MERFLLVEYIESRVHKIDVFLRYHNWMAMRSTPGLEKWHKQEVYALLRSRYEMERMADHVNYYIEPIFNKYEYGNTTNSEGYRTIQSDD